MGATFKKLRILVYVCLKLTLPKMSDLDYTDLDLFCSRSNTTSYKI